MHSVTLQRLAGVLGSSYDGPDYLVSDVHHDSREVVPGTVFVARRGASRDGHDFAGQAIAAGAVAVVVEHEVAPDMPQIVVEDGRSALAIASAEVHGHASRLMTVIGVTGTNGKTTVTHMIEAITRAAGRRSGLVGTVGARIRERDAPQARTTPESSDLQRLFRAMADEGVEIVAVEVSSHALALGRVDETDFAVAAFTNLSQDHLDFHVDMDGYFDAKAQLFASGRSHIGIVWVGDSWGHKLAAEAEIPVRTVGTEPGCNVRGSNIRVDARSSTFTLQIDGESRQVHMPLAGRFNVENALVAAACAAAAGVALEAIVDGLESLPPIPGRFEVVADGSPFAVVVDYAHTPDAIAAVIEGARELAAGKVIVVVGAGGERDRSKRPSMGAAAASADVAIITSDNPRSEGPEAIISEVIGGAPSEAAIVVEPDRRLAVRKALAMAGPGDMVLILGKGHEKGQDIGGRVAPFDDGAVAKEELRSRPDTEERVR